MFGAWDGFFSFEAEARGASRVLATDWFLLGWSGVGGTKDGFNHARQRRRSAVEDMEIDVPNLSPATVGVFDVVLLSGVLYHVRDPLSILETASKVTGECLIIETAIGLAHLNEPAMLYLRAMPYNNDPTNYWAPNPACVVSMPEGLRIQEHADRRPSDGAGQSRLYIRNPLSPV